MVPHSLHTAVDSTRGPVQDVRIVATLPLTVTWGRLTDPVDASLEKKERYSEDAGE